MPQRWTTAPPGLVELGLTRIHASLVELLTKPPTPGAEP